MATAVGFEDLVQRLSGRHGKRMMVAIAGAPGSGKSTLAAELESRLNATSPGTAAVLPMDGYHYDDILLNQLGKRARKGAPDTFDVGGFRHTLMRLRSNDEDHVAVPVFDRDIEIARGGARLIPQGIPVIIVEGNYLLLRDEPWSALKPLFDLTVFVDVSEETLRQRLTARWQGYNIPPDEIRQKVEENDLPNGRFVISRSAAPDIRLSSAG